MKNIVFIGLPGCGKTTVSQRLASLLQRPWYDSDLLISEQEGMSIPEIFETYGEEYFRRAETVCLENLCRMEGIVLAAGGGAALRNAALLKKNATVIYLKRSVESILSTLEQGTRPLLKNPERLFALYEERHSLYESLGDLQVENEQDADTAAKAIKEALT